MKRGWNKKGAEMTIGTIVIIVLAVAVLVFLIFGFSTGWTNLWSKITAFTGGGANVDTVKQACVLACNTQNKYDFCELTRTVKFGDKKTATGTCNNFTKQVDIEGETEKRTVGVEPCPNLCD